MSLPVFGQPLRAKERLGELFNRSSYNDLIKELDEVRNRDQKYFLENDFDYLYARAADRFGKIGKAAVSYQAVVSRDGPLKIYALKHLSRIMRETGNLPMERLYLTELMFSEDPGILESTALERLVRNYFESGDDQRVIEMIEKGEPGITRNDIPNNSRELHVILGNSYLRAGHPREARAVFSELIDSTPNSNQPDDFALNAVRGLDRIEDIDSDPETVADLTAAEHEQRADIYQFNRDFENARLHYKAVIDNHAETTSVPGSMFQIGRGLIQERKYEEAIAWFERIRNEYPKDKIAAPALSALGGVYASLDQTENAVRAYEKYIAEYPDESNIERAYLNIVDAYRDAGDAKRALEWCSKTQTAFRGDIGEAAGLFAEVRIQIAAAEWNRAKSALERLAELDDLGGTRIAGGTNKAEIRFLSGLAFEKLGRFTEARDAYLSIADGRGEYYGWRSSKRLALIQNKGPAAEVSNEERSIEISRRIRMARPGETPNGEKQTDSGLIRESLRPTNVPDGIDAPQLKFKKLTAVSGIAKRLLRLGLHAEGAPEIESELRSAKKIEGDEFSNFDDDTAFTLATFYSKGGDANRAIGFIEPKWKKVPPDFRIDQIPGDQAVLLYPAPFRDALIRFGKQENIDPRFVLSIMRQESRFQADIKSVAAARGLMQFISNTSDKIADEFAIAGFSQDELYAPDTAIRFGTHYIANIFKDFPGQPEAVAASYNAGEDRIARWMKRSESDDPDQYVSEILFGQTKDYVYKVMTNYRMYLLIYDESLEPRKRFSKL